MCGSGSSSSRIRYGGLRWNVMLHMDELENFKPICVDHPEDVEKFVDLLDIAMTIKWKNLVMLPFLKTVEGNT